MCVANFAAARSTQCRSHERSALECADSPGTIFQLRLAALQSWPFSWKGRKPGNLASHFGQDMRLEKSHG
jgi:hypothetical protein